MINGILIVPDIHGEDFWRPALDFNGQVVFLGDYTDPYYHCPDDGLSTFLEIVAFKRQNHDRVTLLLGNHELHYINRLFRCSRFSEKSYPIMHKILTGSDKGLFRVCKQIDNYLFTHAGILDGWLRRNNLSTNTENIEVALNDYFDHNISVFNQTASLRGGSDTYGSPLWADIREHITAPTCFAPNLTQIIGHTRIDSEEHFIHNNIRLLDNSRLYLLHNHQLSEYRP